VPISQDPISRINGVSWGSGCWLGMSDGGSNSSQPGVEFDFPSLSKGVPGFIVPQAFHEGPGAPYGLPAPITKVDMNIKTATIGGRPITGLFGEWFNLFEGGGTTLWISLRGFTNSFPVKLTFLGPGSGQLVATVLLYKRGAIKPGVDPSGLTAAAFKAVSLGLGFTMSATVTVNQKDLTVV
jgi:hypothetical protein